MPRPNKNQNLMEVAEVIAKRSHDAETQVGAILVKNDTGAIIATGYNGFVRGANDKLLPNKRPDKYPYMMHAEQNIIANCARHGISMENCTLICTMSPCVNCMRLLWQTGVTRVVVKELYKDWSDIMKMQDLHVSIEHLDDGYHEIRYNN